MQFFTDLITPTKYGIPPSQAVDTGLEQLANDRGNTASFGATTGLASSYNDFQQQQMANQLRKSMPEFDSLEAQASANYGRQLQGLLSDSDAAASQRSSAAVNLGRGTAGSPAGAAYTLRQLGLSQFQVQTQAQQQLPGYLSAISGIKKAPLFDFSNSFVSADQRIAASFKNNENAWNVANLKAQMKAQPSPFAKAATGLADETTSMASGETVMKSY